MLLADLGTDVIKAEPLVPGRVPATAEIGALQAI
jgi:crotonobetainyl-CoA:carnitine CoA-transferase CaiB-like acyl-CoA transferase